MYLRQIELNRYFFRMNHHWLTTNKLVTSKSSFFSFYSSISCDLRWEDTKTRCKEKKCVAGRFKETNGRDIIIWINVRGTAGWSAGRLALNCSAVYVCIKSVFAQITWCPNSESTHLPLLVWLVFIHIVHTWENRTWNPTCCPSQWVISYPPIKLSKNYTHYVLIFLPAGWVLAFNASVITLFIP